MLKPKVSPKIKIRFVPLAKEELMSVPSMLKWVMVWLTVFDPVAQSTSPMTCSCLTEELVIQVRLTWALMHQGRTNVSNESKNKFLMGIFGFMASFAGDKTLCCQNRRYSSRCR